MSASIPAVTTRLLADRPLAATHVDETGTAITDIAAVLADHGAELASVRPHLPRIMAGGVQSAPTGAVQDPAGSAIGSGEAPSGGGASGAIYDHFPDLAPIPDIPPGASIFNASDGLGRRVLHTHSPTLTTDPADPAGRGTALTDVANAYATALIAFDRHRDALGSDGALLNLTLVSASIYGGLFAQNNPKFHHLDPSYSLAAIALAIHGVAAAGEAAIAPLTVYFFDAQVRADAEALAARLSKG